MPRYLIIPGLGNSGPAHWQSLWENSLPNAARVEQREWDRPLRDEWVATLQRHVENEAGRVVLIGHSLACALIAHWAGRYPAASVQAALLVAPSDVDSPLHTPEESRDFAPMPLARLPFPAVVIASRDDPYIAPARAAAFAAAWGAEFVDCGAIGHVNGASNLGEWPFGKEVLDRLVGSTDGRETVSSP